MPDHLAWPLMLVHLGATLCMMGLIWFVQVVHYPLKGQVGSESFPTYHNAHVMLTGWVVGPPMLLEVTSALALVLWPSELIDPLGPLLGLALLLVVWASTALFSIPAHGRLAQKFSVEVHQNLVRTNWIRTIAWTARALLWLTIIGSMQPYSAS